MFDKLTSEVTSGGEVDDVAHFDATEKGGTGNMC